MGGFANKGKMGISVAVTYSTARGTYEIYRDTELDKLGEELCRADLVVGWNHIQFDYPVLQPHIFPTLADQSINLDMMLDLEQKLGFRLKLDSVASATLGTGSHDITATYAGDAHFTTSTSTRTQTVNAAATTTTLTTSPNPTLSGEPFTATATVAPVAPGAGTPTGTVTFTLSGGTTVDASLVGGAATITAELPAGVHLLSATYHGDGNFTGSTGTETQTVNQASTTTTVTSAPDPSRFGQPVTVTVTAESNGNGTSTPGVLRPSVRR